MTTSTRIFLIMAVALALFACARQGIPSGGPKDTTPPGIDTLHSTPNFATRFEPKKIELKFNEWVILSDAAAQVVVSPPLAKKPEVVLRGKTVVVKFDPAEKFRENTTYTMNFGTAVKDLHESNPAKDLRFVFSTGDFIDSLVTKGRVTDAFTGEPVENVAVMLYDVFTDSVVRKENPYYFSRTDKTGVYEIRNVKAGRFKLAAVEDLDQNLRWDGDNERIGFLDTALVMRDSMRGLTALRIFKNQPKFRVSDKNSGGFGLVRLKFTTTSDSAKIAHEPVSGLKLVVEKAPDSMLVWYDLQPDTTWNLYVNKDTIPVKKRVRADFLKTHFLLFADDIAPTAGGRKLQQPVAPAPTSVKTITQNPIKPGVFAFNYPISAFDTAFWRITLDSLPFKKYAIQYDSSKPRQVAMQTEWISGKTYQLELLPGAIMDLWGQTNKDTLRRQISVPTDKQLGSMSLEVTLLTPGKAYVLQLLNGTIVEEERSFVADGPMKEFVFSKMPVTTYTGRIIADANGNGRWDSGDYWRHRQAEEIYTKKLESLRANWEVKATLSLNTDGPEKKTKGAKKQ